VEELQDVLAPVREKLAKLEAENAALRAVASPPLGASDQIQPGTSPANDQS